MANPALNEKTFAPERVRRLDPGVAGVAGVPVAGAPAGTEEWRTRMTLDGVVLRSAILLPILLATGWLGWRSVDADAFEGPRIPGWLMLAVLAGFGIAIVTVIKPRLAQYTAPVYAAIEGLVLGAISGVYNAAYEGIVVQAVMLTVAVFALMLFLYQQRIVRVTNKVRSVVMTATMAVAGVYLLSMVLNLFGAQVPYIHGSGPIGILFSLAVVGLASYNLLLDFDLIEHGVRNGAPKWMEWYAAFGLLVTLVWLYLELLRLLAKLRDR